MGVGNSIGMFSNPCFLEETGKKPVFSVLLLLCRTCARALLIYGEVGPGRFVDGSRAREGG